MGDKNKMNGECIELDFIGNLEVASDSNIEESNEFPEFYDKCLHRKVSWE